MTETTNHNFEFDPDTGERVREAKPGESSPAADLRDAEQAEVAGHYTQAAEVYKKLVRERGNSGEGQAAWAGLRRLGYAAPKAPHDGVKITGVQIPFFDLVMLIVTVTIAAIPAAIIVAILGAIFGGFLVGLLGVGG